MFKLIIYNLTYILLTQEYFLLSGTFVLNTHSTVHQDCWMHEHRSDTEPQKQDVKVTGLSNICNNNTAALPGMNGRNQLLKQAIFVKNNLYQQRI